MEENKTASDRYSYAFIDRLDVLVDPAFFVVLSVREACLLYFTTDPTRQVKHGK